MGLIDDKTFFLCPVYNRAGLRRAGSLQISRVTIIKMHSKTESAWIGEQDSGQGRRGQLTGEWEVMARREGSCTEVKYL